LSAANLRANRRRSEETMCRNCSAKIIKEPVTLAYRLIVKGSTEQATQAAVARHLEVLHQIELPQRDNTVLVVQGEPDALQKWYGGSSQERALLRNRQPLPPGALLFFQADQDFREQTETVGQ